MTHLDEQGRAEPPIASDEAATLLGFLERQRATFAWKCGGLDGPGLRATACASSMTLGGMLKHLARFEDDMSTEWLHGREQAPPWNAVDWDADPAWDWRTAAEDTPEQLYARWREAVTRSRSLITEALADGGPERRATGVTQPALHPDQHDRGVRPPQRPRRPHPRGGGRARRARSAGLTATNHRWDSRVHTHSVRARACPSGFRRNRAVLAGDGPERSRVAVPSLRGIISARSNWPTTNSCDNRCRYPMNHPW